MITQYSLLRADLMCYNTNRVHCTSAPFHRNSGGSSKPVQWLCRAIVRHYLRRLRWRCVRTNILLYIRRRNERASVLLYIVVITRLVMNKTCGLYIGSKCRRRSIIVVYTSTSFISLLLGCMRFLNF